MLREGLTSGGRFLLTRAVDVAVCAIIASIDSQAPTRNGEEAESMPVQAPCVMTTPVGLRQIHLIVLRR